MSKVIISQSGDHQQRPPTVKLKTGRPSRLGTVERWHAHQSTPIPTATLLEPGGEHAWLPALPEVGPGSWPTLVVPLLDRRALGHGATYMLPLERAGDASPVSLEPTYRLSLPRASASMPPPQSQLIVYAAEGDAEARPIISRSAVPAAYVAESVPTAIAYDPEEELDEVTEVPEKETALDVMASKLGKYLAKVYKTFRQATPAAGKPQPAISIVANWTVVFAILSTILFLANELMAALLCFCIVALFGFSVMVTRRTSHANRVKVFIAVCLSIAAFILHYH